MATPLLLLLPLLLSLDFSSIPFFASANDCSSDELLREGEVRTIKTEDAWQVRGTTEIETTVYVNPKGGFQGVGLQVEDNTRTYHFAWFPLVPEDQCLPQRGEWGEMELKAWIYGDTTPYRLKFWLRYGECFKVCEEDKDNWNVPPSLQSLSVIGQGLTGWRVTKPGNSWRIKEISRSTNRVPSTCLQSPPQGTTPTEISTTRHPPTTPFSNSTTSTSTTTPPSITPTSHPPSPPTAHGRIGTSGTVVVVVWVVGVVVVAMTVVVAVVVVWRICRRGSPSSHVIGYRPHPAQPPPRHSHVSINSLYEPFNNFDNRQ